MGLSQGGNSFQGGASAAGGGSGPYSPSSFTANNILTGNGTGSIQSSGATVTNSGNTLTFPGGSTLIDNGSGELSINGIAGFQTGSASGGAYTCSLYLWFAVKSVTVLTSGTPADIAYITLPAWITRYHIDLSGDTFWFYAETASGTLAGANVQCWSAAGGTGVEFQSTMGLPGAASTAVRFSASTGAPSSSGTVYFRQSANSANAGTVSFYVRVSAAI